MNAAIAKYAENILNSINDGLYITDPSGSTLWVNKMYEELTGLSANQLIGQNVCTLVKKGVFDKVLNPEIVLTKKPATHPQRLANGKSLVLSGYPVFDEAGDLKLVVTFARDITRLAELTESMTEQRKLIDRLSDSIAYQSQQQSKSMMPIYASEQMRSILSMTERVAQSDATILILGETGTGKDVLAHFAHDHSLRKNNVFLKVDCAGLTESLTESELFGYVSGAFTGASSKGKAGYFEMANGGTIFLDEIGELSLMMQSRLLRVLQDHEIIRVGDTKSRKIDVRIIAATNRNLKKLSEDGIFRLDLFYRLEETTLNIPPLRNRLSDIPPLAEHFFSIYKMKYHKSISLAQDVFDAFSNYEWPGNIRQLKNVIHNLIITHNPGIIHAKDLPPEILASYAIKSNVNQIDELKKEKIGKDESYGYEKIQVADFNRMDGASQNQESHATSPYEICASQLLNKTGDLKSFTSEFERALLVAAIKKHGKIQTVADLYNIDRATIFRKLHATPKSSKN